VGVASTDEGVIFTTSEVTLSTALSSFTPSVSWMQPFCGISLYTSLRKPNQGRAHPKHKREVHDYGYCPSSGNDVGRLREQFNKKLDV